MAGILSVGTLTVAWDGVTPAAAPANSTLVMSVNEYSAAGFELTGTFTATLVLEGTINGSTWFSPNCLNIDKSSGTASLTSAGRRLIQLAGLTQVRVRCSSFVSGSPACTLAGSLAGV